MSPADQCNKLHNKTKRNILVPQFYRTLVFDPLMKKLFVNMGVQIWVYKLSSSLDPTDAEHAGHITLRVGKSRASCELHLVKYFPFVLVSRSIRYLRQTFDCPRHEM